MIATRIFKKENGDQYEVTCDFSDSLNSPHWNVWVSKKPKGKRKFTAVGSSDDDLRHKVPYNQRDAYRRREYAKEIPWEWVNTVMDDVVAKIRRIGDTLNPNNTTA